MRWVARCIRRCTRRPAFRIIVKTRRRRLMCSTGRPMRSPWRRMAGWRSGKAVIAHRSIRFTGRASTDWHTGCWSRPGPMMDWSRQRAAHAIVSCSAYSGTRSGVSWTRRSITLFSVRSAKLAGSTNRTDWIPDEFPNAPAQDGYAPRTAGKQPAALAEGAAHHRGRMPGPGHHRQRARQDHSRRQVLA
ncbi:hypothetical protein BN1263180135 [Stenotrophomonas maltophilia]|nr:hypothetical protein BN1263180135 [Stenotrophomonas maltophilia]